MASSLPMLIVMGGLALGAYLLINPELRCSVLSLCGKTEREPENVVVPPPAAAEPEDDDPQVQPVINNFYPAPIVTPRPVIIRGGPNSAVNDCCDCRMQSDGRVRCRTNNRGSYNISYSGSARYDAVEAARQCSRDRCRDDHPKPRPVPQPPTCPTKITKYGRQYYITNLTTLPIQTAVQPPNYIKEGRCIYQLIATNTVPPSAPPPSTTNCSNPICKSLPYLCPKCVHPTPAAASGYARSLFASTRIAI